MYSTDGSVHHSGINTEKETIKFLNDIKFYSEPLVHLGGTKNKADAIAGEKQWSIKKKNGIRNGSFDFFNTSSYNSFLGNHFDGFLEEIKEHRDMSITLREVSVSLNRTDFSRLCLSAFSKIDTDNLTQILTDTFQNDCYDIIINDVVAKKLYIFPLSDHPVSVLLARGATPILTPGRGRSSQKILFLLGDEIIDDGLRLRITSNNGIRAFLGLSKANRNSQVVMKLQQDNIPNILRKSNPQIIDY